LPVYKLFSIHLPIKKLGLLVFGPGEDKQMESVSNPHAAALRRKTRRRFRLWPSIVTIGVLLALGWWGWSATHASKDTGSPLITAKVVRGDLEETISATGSVTAQTGAEVKIGSQITGVIKRLYTDVGQIVHKGAPIAELDLPDITAQRNEAQANLAAAEMKLQQDLSGVQMLKDQTNSAVTQAKAQLRSAEAQLASAKAAARQQEEQTRTDIQKAQAALSAAKAALSTAQATLRQTQASANLEIATAQAQLTQAQATAHNAELNLRRQKQLLQKGFVAQSAVDDAQATYTVDEAQVAAAQQNVELVRQKVTADLQTAQDQVTQAQQNLDSAKAAYDAAKAEVYQNAVKEADVRNAQAAVKQAKANLISAQASLTQNLLKQQTIVQDQDQVAAARQQVAYWNAQVNKTIIRSPITGTVLQLASQQGETLVAGLSAPTLIIVADLHRLQIDAYVDETDIGKVKLGQEADCTVDAFPHTVIKGHVAKIASGSTIMQGVVTYDVTIALDHQYPGLKPDMTANVIIHVGKLSNVLLVPAESVHLGVHGATVDVLTMKDGKQVITPHVVKVGGSDGVNTAILAGLNEGDTIVRAGTASSNRPMWGNASPFTSNNKNKQKKPSNGGS
jgi:HlyD family secretion protein